MKFWYDKEYKGVMCEPSCVDEWLELIWDVALDYDGCNTVESLKDLVDEIIKMSDNARTCLYDGKLFENKEESDKSYEAAKSERDKHCDE